jgi:hypothetical protein
MAGEQAEQRKLFRRKLQICPGPREPGGPIDRGKSWICSCVVSVPSLERRAQQRRCGQPVLIRENGEADNQSAPGAVL